MNARLQKRLKTIALLLKPQVQKFVHLFIDYFEKRIDLKILKSKLAELEKTK